MGENRERAGGMADQFAGKVKQGVGSLTGNEQVEAEGRAQELRGESRQETAETVGTARGMGEEAKGNIKQGAGNLLDNEQMQAEGQVEELKGKARQTFNQ